MHICLMCIQSLPVLVIVFVLIPLQFLDVKYVSFYTAEYLLINCHRRVPDIHNSSLLCFK